MDPASRPTARLLTFDMGGTSTDVALVEGDPRLTTEGRIAGFPVAVPMVDMHTIGAGGGSIARLDPAGMLLVGPESAGAAPGPVCYGKGGVEPTVTDANLVLGRLPVDAFLGGRITLDTAAARSALSALGMLVAPPGRLLTKTWLGLLAERTDREVAAQLDELSAQGREGLVREGQAADALRVCPSLDLRYPGQVLHAEPPLGERCRNRTRLPPIARGALRTSSRPARGIGEPSRAGDRTGSAARIGFAETTGPRQLFEGG
jgi:N-methylhydantoinase A/oxoprolinase/acetone carboxylase beta subunit